MEKTLEDPSVVSPEDRERVFGQFDHVRLYGQDYRSRLESAGFTVKVYDPEDEQWTMKPRNHSINPDEKLYVVYK
jgi:hypothetical protein